MNRRKAIQLILATGIAPVFVRADILMPVSEIIVPKITLPDVSMYSTKELKDMQAMNEILTEAWNSLEGLGLTSK